MKNKRIYNINDCDEKNRKARNRIRRVLKETDELIARIKTDLNKDYRKEFEDFKKRNDTNYSTNYDNNE